MKNSNIILYAPGAYGNFINWCCDYFKGNLNSHDIPLNDLGNCHQYENAMISLLQPPELKNYTENDIDKQYEFIQLHPFNINQYDNLLIRQGKYWECLDPNLEYLENNYKKTVFIYPTQTSKLWITNNVIYKIKMSDWAQFGFVDDKASTDYFLAHGMDLKQIDSALFYGEDRIKKQIVEDSLEIDKFQAWGHNNIDEFERWELREFGSKYYYDRIEHSIIPIETIEKAKVKFPHIKFIELDQLKNNFQSTIITILEHFQISPINNWSRINHIHKTWIDLQIHIYKDQQVNQIVDSMIKNTLLDWSDWGLTLIDEMAIQRRLLDNNIKISCWNLNQFPTNSKQLVSLLERD